jgi:multiple sugar transport system ATP-binding protein
MAEVALENVTKIYPGGIRAVADLSLRVHDRERVVLVGPSGSGKSTALRLIAGLEAPTSGTVSIGGRVVNGVAPRERNVALVFQRPTFYPHLRVRDNLAFGHRLRTQPGRLSRWLSQLLRPEKHREYRQNEEELRVRVAEAARQLELEDVLDRFPGQLSGGQQQRVALGRALVRRPAVFLLDEPLSNLEPRLRYDLRRELHLLQQRLDATMITVTHDQAEALTFGERVVVMDRGIVQQADRPEVLYERPCNRFVAGFIGWPPMNFLPGRVSSQDGVLQFVTQAGVLALPPGLSVDWKQAEGRGLELGIRPEHVSLTATPAPGASLGMTVELIESLGGSALVTCRREAMRVTARVGPRPSVAVGQGAEVAFDMAQVYLFDAVSGLCVPARAG